MIKNKNMKLQIQLYIILVFTFLITTSQTCKQVTPTSCSDVDVFYGPLVQTYGLTSDGNQNQQDRFFLGNLYYKSANSDLKAIKIDFGSSSVESVTAATGISNYSSNDELRLQKSGNSNLPTTGSSFTQIATVAWRVKYTDFDKTFGKQKFTFMDGANQPFSECQPNFIDPPMLHTFNNEAIAKLAEGYTPLAPETYADVRISNNNIPVIICTEDGVLKEQVNNSRECSYKHIELTYQCLNKDEMPLKMLRNDVLPRELIERILRINKGTYNGNAWWCDNGDLITSKFCKSCGPQNTCRMITFKM